MNILAINQSRLRNEGHYQVMSGIAQITQQYITEEMELDEILDGYNSALDNERTVIEFIKQQSPLMSIKAAEIEMKKVFACLVQSVKRYDNAQMYPEKYVAVESTMIVVRHYKKLMYRNLAERHATVGKFIKDLREDAHRRS